MNGARSIVGVSRALVSFWTSTTDKQFRDDHLKLCALWYDEVLYQRVGPLDRDAFLRSLVLDEENGDKTAKALTDLVVPLETRVSADTLLAFKQSEPPGYPRWGDRHQNYTYPEPEAPHEFAHNCLLAQIAAEHGVDRFFGNAVQLAEGRAKVAVEAVRLWDQVSRESPCMLQAGPDEKVAMAAAQQFVARAKEARSAFSLLEVAVPSLAGVPWSRIVEFRRDGALVKLRNQMATAVERSGTDLEAAKQALGAAEKDAMDAIVERARPRPLKVAIEAVLANVPGLPVNPASVYFGARDTVTAVRRKGDYGWLYLLRDIRAAAGP